MAPKVVKFLGKSKSVRADILKFTKIWTGILEHSRSVNSSSLYGNSKETNFLPILFISKESNGEKLVRMTYRTRAIISRGLYIFYPIFEDHFFVFKEAFSENSVLMYG